MPNQKALSEKQVLVEALTQKLKSAKSIVLVDYKGIKVVDDTNMRAELRDAGVDYKVYKNTLLEFAAKNAGLENLIPTLAGTTALAVSSDEIAPAKVMLKYSDKNKDKFNFKIGYIDGKYVSADELKSIASLPSRDGLVAMVAGTLNSIIASLARAVSEVAKKSA
ncbi:MAG: 50S ribosomal protein L10 [Oscillospiraceae bacterium]